MEKASARMIRAAYEWMDGLVSAYVRANHPESAVIAVYAMSRGQLPEAVRAAISSVLHGTEPAGWGCVTLFLFPDERAGAEAMKAMKEAIRGAASEPLHLDLYHRGSLADRAHL